MKWKDEREKDDSEYGNAGMSKTKFSLIFKKLDPTAQMAEHKRDNNLQIHFTNEHFTAFIKYWIE